MTMKALTYPDVVIPGGFSMDAATAVTDGLGYTPDANGVLTVAGADAVFVVYPKKRAAAGEKNVTALMIGAPLAKIGAGGATFGQSLKMGAGGMLIGGTEGTDAILAIATQACDANGIISVSKFR